MDCKKCLRIRKKGIPSDSVRSARLRLAVRRFWVLKYVSPACILLVAASLPVYEAVSNCRLRQVPRRKGSTRPHFTRKACPLPNGLLAYGVHPGSAGRSPPKDRTIFLYLASRLRKNIPKESPGNNLLESPEFSRKVPVTSPGGDQKSAQAVSVCTKAEPGNHAKSR